MRAFVAIYPPLEARKDLIQKAKTLLTTNEFRWTKSANVHLTLKFLGDVNEEDLTGLEDVLKAVSGRHAQFVVEPLGIGAFPSSRKARVVWAGVDEGAEALRALALDLQDSTSWLDRGREIREFTPHITLGRARNEPISLPETRASYEGRFVTEHIELIRSVPGEDGLTHETLSRYALRPTPH
jgi:2'-5' RNA ligase